MKVSKLCRVCFKKSDGSVNIFEKEPHKLSAAKMLEEICGVKISKKDLLSQIICNQCLIETKITYCVRQRCIESDKRQRSSNTMVRNKHIVKEQISEKSTRKIKLSDNDDENSSSLDDHNDYSSELTDPSEEKEAFPVRDKCQNPAKEKFPLSSETEFENQSELTYANEKDIPEEVKISKKKLRYPDPFINERNEFICVICYAILKSWQSWNAHHYQKHSKKTCGVCTFECVTFQNLKEHYENCHMKGKFLSCPICGKGFRSRHGLIGHYNCHKSTSCNIKEETISSETNAEVASKQNCHDETIKSVNYADQLVEKVDIKENSDDDWDQNIPNYESDSSSDHKIVETITKPSNDSQNVVKKEDDFEWDDLTVTEEVNDKFIKDFIPVKRTGTRTISIMCFICQESFPSKLDKQRHVTLNHPPNIQCSVCGKTFKQARKYERHMEIHICGDYNWTMKHSCDICNFSSSKTDIECHMFNRHLRIKFHPCDICGNSFQNSTLLRQHMFTNHDTQPTYICSKCGQGFAMQASLKHHRNKNCLKTSKRGGRLNALGSSNNFPQPEINSNGAFQCPDCPKEYFIKSSWYHHYRSNHRMMGYKCRFCEQEFTHRYNLKKHLKEIHGQQEDHVCHICGKKYLTADGLNLHMRYTHEPHMNDSKNSLKVNKCRKCCKSFPSVESLQQHKNEFHPKVLKEKCYICLLALPSVFAKVKHINREHSDCVNKECAKCGQKKFSTASRFEIHMRKHEVGKTEICKYCNKKFSVPRTLASHINSKHKGKKLFKCEICGDSISSTDMARHLAKHKYSNENFNCSKCKNSFYSKILFDRHMVRVHGSHPGVECFHCGTFFKTKPNIVTHFRQKHCKIFKDKE
ncbi:CLUMA_CG002677, isoform A [Clunio marinus]|uniref:CLUMA_CG002677, isoform A n=1 Tax=Clunio marinus TaxID=568069 RepID=A0A1J1HM32_9DIPT|nr:CLUMA_CG002677, isoform A [Clunio marinus]